MEWFLRVAGGNPEQSHIQDGYNKRTFAREEFAKTKTSAWKDTIHVRLKARRSIHLVSKFAGFVLW